MASSTVARGLPWLAKLASEHFGLKGRIRTETTSSMLSAAKNFSTSNSVRAGSTAANKGQGSITRFNKQHRGRMKGISTSGDNICFGKFALQALESAWVTSRQIEAGRLAIQRNVPRGGKIWVRVIPDKPITARPAETRMGRGKGSTKWWAGVVKPCRVLYEISGVTESIARMAISIAGSKMPIRTQFIVSK